MRPRPTAGGASPKIGLIVLGLTVVGVVALMLALPGLVKKKCIDAAAAEGVTVTIGGAQLAWGEVHLTDVTFKIDDVPQMSGVASDVDVTLDGLTPQAVAVRGAGITLDGPADEISAAVDKWRASHAKAPG